MTTVDTWLAGGDVLASVHGVGTSVTTGVVICPPIGQEQILGYRTQRLLADRLAAAGFAAVRLDHVGFGDSTSTTPDLLAGPTLAADALRAAGVGRIVYVGLASGALVAAGVAARDADAAGLVLWDPPASGRAWLRATRVLQQMVESEIPAEARQDAGPDDDGFVTVVGADLPADLADRFGPARYDAAVADRMPVLVAVRSGGTGSVPPPFRGDSHVVDVIEVDGHAQLLDTSSLSARIPVGSVDAVAGWVTDTFGTAVAAPVTLAWEGRGSVRFDAPVPDGVPSATTVELEETIRRIGPHALFGIETAAVGLPDDAPAVVLMNGSSEHRIGVTRMQVDLARRLAADGARVIRFDRRGTGESTPVEPGERSLLFTAEWVEDATEVVRSLGLPRARVLIAGLSVGGWLGLTIDPSLVGTVVALSPADFRVHPAAPDAVADEDAAATSSRAAASGPAADGDGQGLKGRLVDAAKHYLPYPVLLELARRGKVQLVEPFLRGPLTRGVDTVLVLGPHDREVFEERHGPRALRRLRNLSGCLQVVDVPTADHALFVRSARVAAADAVVAAAHGAFGSALVPPTAAVRTRTTPSDTAPTELHPA